MKAMVEIRKLLESEFEALRKANIQTAKLGFSQIKKVAIQEAEEFSERQVNQELKEARASDNNYFMAIVLKQSNEVIGSLWYRKPKEAFFEDVAFLAWFGIYTPYQNKGYGKQAMELLIRKIKNEGFSRIALDVFNTNTPAWSLYKSCGFEPARTVMHKYL